MANQPRRELELAIAHLVWMSPSADAKVLRKKKNLAILDLAKTVSKKYKNNMHETEMKLIFICLTDHKNSLLHSMEPVVALRRVRRP